jgi:hypothetical protein
MALVPMSIKAKGLRNLPLSFVMLALPASRHFMSLPNRGLLLHVFQFNIAYNKEVTTARVRSITLGDFRILLGAKIDSVNFQYL